jgi:aminoglycoside/choline kinase family phosphotransferase
MSARPVPRELLPWAADVLACNASDLSVESVAGDASNRHYYRLSAGSVTYVLAHAPPETEKNEEFAAIAAILANAGVRVPHLYAIDLIRGFMLLEDLGDQALLPLLNAQSVDALYGDAFVLLDGIGSVDTAAVDTASVDTAAVDTGDRVLPRYDLALLAEELGRFSQWFVEALLGRELPEKDRGIIARFNQVLIANALEQPQVLVHRDFHSRNVMVLANAELVLIDFQDAVVGPVTYDLVSLLRDCYIRWPEAQVSAWALHYKKSVSSCSELANIDDDQFLRWFDWMGLQRHIKVLGTFARLFLRDGKVAYLEDLPLVIQYVQEIVQKYAADVPVFAEFGVWFARELSPAIDTQSWSKTS